jgi:hypothetical protein
MTTVCPRFAQLKQLKTIAKYLPCVDFKLEPAIYEMVLFDFLKTDTDGEWAYFSASSQIVKSGAGLPISNSSTIPTEKDVKKRSSVNCLAVPTVPYRDSLKTGSKERSDVLS